MTTASLPWFRLSDQLPPLTVAVWLNSRGREFLGLRGVMHGRERWAAWKNGKPEPLADDTLAAALGDRDGLWRPQNLAMWALPLPDPVTLSEARMSSEQVSFDAVAAAAEMEADRTTANAGAGPGGGKRELWWLKDGLTLRRDPPGSIRIKDCEARLMRCLADDDFGRLIVGAGFTGASLYRELCVEMGVAEAFAICKRLAESENATTPEFRPPFKPMPADLADQDTVMIWYRGMAAKHRVVTKLASRTIGYSYAEIADQMHLKCRRRAKELYESAITEAHRIANGSRTDNVDALAVEIDRVRERNSRAKRLAG